MMKVHFEKIGRSIYQRLLVGVTLLLCLATAVHAATEAGTVIKNQASASYRDSFGVRRIATSNVVETLIRQVAAIELTQDQNKPGIAGQEHYFTHIVSNTGNGLDSFSLTTNSVGGGGFAFTTIEIYADDDRNGQPDSDIPITRSRQLAAGESQSVVIAAAVPANAASGNTGRLTIEAVSQFDNSVSAQNTDTVTATAAAVVSVSKSIDVLQGSSPGGPFTVTISYQNNSSQTATDLAIMDALPVGMSYVPLSGRWSATGPIVLSDSNPNDTHSGAGTDVRYCAYDASCTGLPEANADADTQSTNQVTAIIGVVDPGASGEIQFQVQIDSGLPPSVLLNLAEIEYQADATTTVRVNSNYVPFRVTHGTLVVINGSVSNSTDGTAEPLDIASSVSADLQAGNDLFYRNVVWNNGNGTDTFDITTSASTFPTGTVFRVLQSDAQTPLLDTSGNGIVDTGPIAPGGSYETVLQVVLPDGNTGSNFEVTVAATSATDATINNTIINRLISVAAGDVDITNTAGLGDADVTGVGTGPEAAPVTSVVIAPGSTGLLDLFINNTSANPMDFDLAASINSDFSSIELPENWSIEFQLDSGDVVSNTGVIAPGEFIKVTAMVRVPPDVNPQDVSIYFRALNERFSVSDITHDQFSVEALPSLLLTINQEGQVSPGGTTVYQHSLLNSGNTDINNISLSLTDDRAADGWSSLIYEDTDGDGSLSADDQIINTVNLPAGESIALFVRVFAPASAVALQFNSTVITVTDGVITQTVTDITNVTTGEISVQKEQALDNGCDGVLDTPYSFSVFAVEPGNNCISYRLTASNGGSASVLNVVVADATPSFTSYSGSASCSKTNCTINEPAAGGEGEVIASLPELVAGDSVVVEFMVRID